MSSISWFHICQLWIRTFLTILIYTEEVEVSVIGWTNTFVQSVHTCIELPPIHHTLPSQSTESQSVMVHLNLSDTWTGKRHTRHTRKILYKKKTSHLEVALQTLGCCLLFSWPKYTCALTNKNLILKFCVESWRQSEQPKHILVPP